MADLSSSSDELEGRAVFSAGLRAGGRLCRGSPPRLGRQAGRRPRILSADRPRARREDDVPFDDHRDGRTARRGRSPTATASRFPKNMGGKRRFTVDRVEFAGYGLDAPGAGHIDFRGKDVKDAAVVWLGAERPQEPRSVDLSPRADRAQPLRDRAARRGREHRAASEPAAGRAGRAGGAGAAGGAGNGRRRARRADSGRRLHDRAAARHAACRRTSRANDAFFDVPLQPGAGQVRRAEAQGGRAGAAAVVPRSTA